MKVEIIEEAQQELDQAIGYHENIEPGLGIRLKDELRHVIDWIRMNPEVPSVRIKGYRRVNFKVFPYYVAYFIWSDIIWVLAIAHSKKRPEFWIRRKTKVK